MQEQIEAVQRMQDYIESHLFENINLADLSSASFFSPWYSHKLFIRHVGISPADYIRKYRLSKSALTLRDNPRKIAEVAFEMGFGSVDGYQRAFFREFGCNPSEYASMPVPLYLFTPVSLSACGFPLPTKSREPQSTCRVLRFRPITAALCRKALISLNCPPQNI